MLARYLFATLVLGALLAFSACASGGNPLTPSPVDANCDRIASAQLWGYWDVTIDPSNGSVEIIPLRSAQFAANVTVFLQPPLGSTANMGIKVIDMSQFLTEGLIDVDVTLHHPFPGLDMYTGFDVMGIFIHNGDKTGIYDTTVNRATGNGTALLLNADGYTRWYNPVEFTAHNIVGFVEGALGTKGANFSATLNPYKYFCDGLSEEENLTAFLHDPANLAKRGSFSPTVNKRRYELKFPMVGGSPELKFQYAVVANWEPPEGELPWDIPGDFPISANRAEPFHLDVTDNGSSLWYKDSAGGGIAKFKAELFDWGAPSNPQGVLGEISKIVLESDDVTIPGGYLTMTPSEFFATADPGTDVSSVATVEIEGLEPLHPGEAQFLITIESSAPTSYDQGFSVPIPDAPLASYFLFTLPVLDENPCVPPVVSLVAPDSGLASHDIEFDATGTTGTPPLTFQWDWDGDGTYDEDTDTGLVAHKFPPGVWNVGLRVSNACGEDVLTPPHQITITCSDEVYDTLLGIVICQGNFTTLRQDGTAFLPDGRYLVKAADQLVAYEVTTPGDIAGQVIISDMANAGTTAGGSYHFLANLDYDEALDRIAYSTLYGDNERVTVYESNGTYVTDFVVPGTGGEIDGIDTDSDGSIWCVYHTPGGTTGTNTLTHWAWNSSTGHYEQVVADTFDCTFVVGGARGIYDIAVIPEAQRLYILHIDAYPWQGAVYVIDISTSPPTHMSSLSKNQIFSWTNYDHAASISDFNKWEGSSIEVDHGDGTAETCRLIVQMSFQSNGNGIGFMKFDSDLNELDNYRIAGTRLESAAIRPGDSLSDRLLVMPTWTVNSCSLYVYSAPAGW